MRVNEEHWIGLRMESGCLEREKYVGCVHCAWNKLMHTPTTIEIEYSQCSFNVHWIAMNLFSTIILIKYEKWTIFFWNLRYIKLTTQRYGSFFP